MGKGREPQNCKTRLFPFSSSSRVFFSLSLARVWVRGSSCLGGLCAVLRCLDVIRNIGPTGTASVCGPVPKDQPQRPHWLILRYVTFFFLLFLPAAYCLKEQNRRAVGSPQCWSTFLTHQQPATSIRCMLSLSSRTVPL